MKTKKVSLVLHQIKEMEIEERILQKAHELFTRIGIRSVSMDEIAAQLGISKKTIYHYYKDKDALVDGVLEIEISKKIVDCAKTKLKRENAVHEIFVEMDILEELFATFNPSVLFDLEKYHPVAFKKFTDHHNSFMYQNIRENIETGIAEGNYRQGIDLDIITKYKIGSMFLVFNSNYFPHGGYPLSKLCLEITDHFLHGLVTPKGKELIDKYKQERQKE
jgi:AcrR family transcriptional regulator